MILVDDSELDHGTVGVQVREVFAGLVRYGQGVEDQVHLRDGTGSLLAVVIARFGFPVYVVVRTFLLRKLLLGAA